MLMLPDEHEEFVSVISSGAVTISEERKVCTGSEKFFKMCESNEVGQRSRPQICISIKAQQPPLTTKTIIIITTITRGLYVFQLDLTFHLFVCALAGAGAAVIAMVMIIILKCALLDLTPIRLSVSRCTVTRVLVGTRLPP